MALLKLTLAALSLAVYYSSAMQSSNPSTNQSSRNISRQSSLTSSFNSRSGDPPADNEADNIDRVLGAINQDPCFLYQQAKLRLQASQGPARSTSRGSRESSDSVSPNKAQALRACASAVNAYRALSDDLKEKCPTAYASDCREIDDDLLCVVLFTKTRNILGCFNSSTHASLSLRKCASDALRRREESRQRQAELQNINDSYARLHQAASQTDYGRSTTDASSRGRSRHVMNRPADAQALEEMIQRRFPGRPRAEIQPASRQGSGEIQPASRQGPGEMSPDKSFTHIGRLPTDRSGCSSQPPPPPPPPSAPARRRN